MTTDGIQFISTNIADEGTVFVVSSNLDPSILQFCEVPPTAFQRNNRNIERKFILKTGNDTPKKDLVVTKAAMPKPFLFENDKYSIDGVLVPPPETWHLLKKIPASEDFDVVVEPVSLEELSRPRKIPRN
jgi:hypothetical protein